MMSGFINAVNEKKLPGNKAKGKLLQIRNSMHTCII